MEIVGDDHGAATQHVTGAHQDGQSDLLSDAHGLFGNERGAVARLGNAQVVEQASEAAAVLRQIDGLGGSADNRNAVVLQVEGQVQRRLTAKLNDDALGALAVHDGENIFQSQRLEIEAVGGVVIGGDGLGIAIDHDGFVAVFTERERGMAAAVIELDSLPDAIGAAAEDGDFRPVAGVGLVFFLVRGVKIRSEGLKFGGAGIDALENGLNAQFTPALAHRCRLYVP